MNRVIVHGAPAEARGSGDYTVHIRTPGGEWQELFVYEVKVDMHQVRQASMAVFDMDGTVEVRVVSKAQQVRHAVIRPLASGILGKVEGDTIRLQLDRPCKLSVEVNGDRFSNLHLFANPLEQNAPDPDGDGVLYLKPALHRTEDIYRLAHTPKPGEAQPPHTIFFGPGKHWLEETVLRIPSGISVYLAGGAIVAGSLVCDQVRDVSIKGRGMLELSDFHRFSAFRGIRIVNSENISVEGITTLDPPHYSIYLGASRHVQIRNFKSFSTRGWSDGIDMMACCDIDIEDVFLRTSDDCIAVYGSRWDYRGDSRGIAVRNSVLWADVAHPIMIGTHGDHHRNGDTIEDLWFENIDILEHHEPQENYMGAMAINAGDHNTVRRVTFRSIRVEDFELGRLFDIRVAWNQDYNPVPGQRIESIRFENISYNGANRNPSRILGFDGDRCVTDVWFKGLTINGKEILGLDDGNIEVNEYAHHIVVE